MSVKVGGLDQAIRIEAFGDLHDLGGLGGRLLTEKEATALSPTREDERWSGKHDELAADAVALHVGVRLDDLVHVVHVAYRDRGSSGRDTVEELLE